MKAIVKMMLLALVAVSMLVGCGDSKEKQIYTAKEHVYKFAAYDAMTAYTKSTSRFVDVPLEEIEAEVIKPIKFNKNITVEENNGITIYKVKCRIDYNLRVKNTAASMYVIRYSALVIEKKGFADPQVLREFSKEVYIAEMNKEYAEKSDLNKDGKELIK